ncbi:MAG: glycosyltransferase [Mangrovibacterium sp.]
MKIGYFLAPKNIISGDSNGIKGQARAWKMLLTDRGHEVVELNVWGNYDWKQFDIIHIFGFGPWLPDFLATMTPKNPAIVISPIIDTIQPVSLYKLSTFCGCSKLRMTSPTHALKNSIANFKGIFTRTDYESVYVNKALGCPKEYIYKIPLTYEVDATKQLSLDKENFCLHISSIYQKRKNVIRLIKAAKKYNFQLVLAGSKGTEEEFAPLKKEIGNAENIQVLGYISEEKKYELYSKAKVFALPSISEGVGLVALDAAVNNCEIVITKIGGPKEYYGDLAEVVNPYSVDEIGVSVSKLLSAKGYQPKLKEHILKSYNPSYLANCLEKSYLEIIARV